MSGRQAAGTDAELLALKRKIAYGLMCDGADAGHLPGVAAPLGFPTCCRGCSKGTLASPPHPTPPHSEMGKQMEVQRVAAGTVLW